ncbi:MAG: electron transport complex subunit RsxG [Alishewanella aestuarii]
MIRFISKNALILALVALLCVAILGTINQLAAERIAEQQLLSRMNTLQEVLPEPADVRTLLADCVQITAPEALGRSTAQAVYRWRDQQQLKAFIVETTAPDGYSGNIDLLVAVTPDGEVLGSRVLNHQETPGLGDKIESRRNNWIYAFSGQSATEADAKRWAVKKDGGDFDQFTGATITPRAVINAIYRTARFVQQHPELADATANCEVMP